MEDLMPYHERRIRLVNAINSMGWGARRRAALDLDTWPSEMTKLLNGTIYRPELLGRLEEWVIKEQDKADAKRSI